MSRIEKELHLFDVTYAIRLKENGPLRNAATNYFSELCELTKENQVDYAVVYGEFV